jgi:hypothetical protein
MYINLTRGEAVYIRDLLKSLLEEDTHLPDLEREIMECYDIIHASLATERATSNEQLDLFQ